jgi:hypothetical protein
MLENSIASFFFLKVNGGREDPHLNFIDRDSPIGVLVQVTPLDFERRRRRD